MLQVAKRTKLFILFFLFLFRRKIHSADINLRIKVVISKLKQFAIQGGCDDELIMMNFIHVSMYLADANWGGCLALSFSPYKVPLSCSFAQLGSET